MHLCEIHQIGARTRERLIDPRTVPEMQREGLVLAGLSSARAGFRFCRHQPPMGQVLACLAGRGRVWLGDAWAPCGPGEAYCTPPGVLHAYEAMDLGPWDLAWVMVSPEAWPRECAAPALHRCEAELLGLALDGLHRESLGCAAESVVWPWVSLVARYAQRAARLETRCGDARLQRLLDRLVADLGRPWTLATMARAAGLSPEHLRRLAKVHWGVSPVRRLTQLRMERAQSLLAHRGIKVATVAEAVGYANAFAFSVAYRRHLGHSPRGSRGREERGFEGQSS